MYQLEIRFRFIALAMLALTLMTPTQSLAQSPLGFELVAALDNPRPDVLGGFGNQVAIGDGFFVTRSGHSGEPDREQVHIYSTADGSYLHSFEVKVACTAVRAESLAIDESRLLVGSSGSGNAVAWGGEATELFDITNGNLLQTFAKPSDARRFGYSVDIAGDIVLIGDPFLDRVHVFSASSGQEITVLHPPDLPPLSTEHKFGSDISISGDLVAIADQSRNSVFLYNTVSWELEHSVHRPSDTTTQRPWFGSAIDLEGHKLVVGALRSNVLGPLDGGAYLYDLHTGASTELIPSAAGINGLGQLGFDAEISDEWIAIGSAARNSYDYLTGQVLIFSAETGDFLGHIPHPAPQLFKRWGWAIGFEDGVLASGDYIQDLHNETGFHDRAGRAYIFHVVPEPPSALLAGTSILAILVISWRGVVGVRKSD
ncbi:YncE family protein [Aeoliella sp. SH292]|uniref:YncE family protein n=1 Tax=Aeoliella sp. SH292 TaxID=3454464 RepID=UPI003F97EEAF